MTLLRVRGGCFQSRNEQKLCDLTEILWLFFLILSTTHQCFYSLETNGIFLLQASCTFPKEMLLYLCHHSPKGENINLHIFSTSNLIVFHQNMNWNMTEFLKQSSRLGNCFLFSVVTPFLCSMGFSRNWALAFRKWFTGTKCVYLIKLALSRIIC